VSRAIVPRVRGVVIGNLRFIVTKSRRGRAATRKGARYYSARRAQRNGHSIASGLTMG
jgi:hypothetical protein